MAKRAQSQWEFGDLFSTTEPQEQESTGESSEVQKPESSPQVYSVTGLTRAVRNLLERRFGQLWVTGEISNLRQQSSGHIYFSLKDANSQLSCVLFRGEAIAERALLKDGEKVVLQGDVTVYEPRGQYQLRVRKIELQGTGALQQAFERLKRKLDNEGLFATEQKRRLPPYPQRIGLITSPTGAAIRDIIHVVRRRYAGLEIIFVPCRVQGQGAESEIAGAIRLLNEWSDGHPPKGELQSSDPEAAAGPPRRPRPLENRRLDLILVTRGGGSLEDLWAFNEEALAREIFNSSLPVVSAVGHEIDFTISDFAADVRAPTPSAAAEIITEGMFSCRQFVHEVQEELQKLVRDRLTTQQRELRRSIDRLSYLHPRRQLERYFQRIDDLESDLKQQLKFRYQERLNRWQRLTQSLSSTRPSQVVAHRRERLAQAEQQVSRQFRERFQELRQRLEKAETRLHLLSPQNVLNRGYSITLDAETREIIRSPQQTKSGQTIRSCVQGGEIESRVEES